MQARNVIYVVAHDLGKELGTYGSCFPTPNLDRLADRGVAFDEAYCTSPCCSPSRGCAMTGRTAHSNGLAGLANPGAEWKLPPSVRTIVDDFNDAGYETVHAGMEHERQNKHANRYRRVLDCGGWVEQAVDAAIGFLEPRSSDAPPFYLNVGTNEVHSGQWQTWKHDRRHSRWKDVYGLLPDEQVELPPFLPDTPEMRREWAAFGGCVRYYDTQIGRLLDAVERLGYTDDTLIVFTTDHGVAAHRAKGTLYRAGVEIALLMQLPGRAEPATGPRYDGLIQNIDYRPTLLDACGIAPPAEVQGRSFWPLLTGGDYPPHEAICLERNFHGDFDPMRSIRTTDWTLIRNFDPSRTRCWTPPEVEPDDITPRYEKWYTEMWPAATQPRPEYELFDRRQDPREWHNLADRPEHQAALAELNAGLDDWMHATADPLLETTDPDRFKQLLWRRTGHPDGAESAK